MAFDFPDSPAVNDEYVSGGATYTWTGLVWDLGGSATIDDKVDRAGDTMTGPLRVQTDPAHNYGILSGGGSPTNGALLEWYNVDGTRKAFLGWGISTELILSLESANAFVIKGGNIYMQDGNGIHWGNNSPVTVQHDYSKGICLYGINGTSQFGFYITSGTLNYGVQNAGNKHQFVVGTENKLQINAAGLTIPSVADNKNGYFVGDRYHGMYFHGGNKLVFTEYHDHFNWRRQTTGTTGLGGDQRMTLIGGNLDAAGTVSTRAIIDRSMLETRPDLESFADGEDPADSEIPQRGINLGKLLLHALDRIAELEARIKRFEDL